MQSTSQHPFSVKVQWAVSTEPPPHHHLTPAQVRACYQRNNPDGHCFDRKSMRFFGDTMRNFRAVRTLDGYRLERRRPVRHGLSSALVFDAACNFIGTAP